MISEDTLKEAARRLGEAARPAKVISFGSYARGDAAEGSDVDFLVIEPEVKNRGEEMIRLHRTFGWYRCADLFRSGSSAAGRFPAL